MTMKISEININDTTRRCAVETTADYNIILRNEEQRFQYIAEYGDVDVVYDTYYKIYRVDAHKVERDEAIAIKAKYCKQYGSS